MSSSQFALIDKGRAYLGVGLQGIVRSWSGLRRVRGIAVGYISYDQQVYFGVFKKLQRVPLKQLTDPTPWSLGKIAGEKFSTYKKKIENIKRHLAIGDIYQANYCYRLSAKTDATANQLLHRFTQKQPTPYAAFINTPDVQIISNSPELGIRIEGAAVECRPMKGTRPKAVAKKVLVDSNKDKAELDMITDVVRNDLAQFAVPGSVVVKRRRQIVGFNTVWQAQSVVQAKRPRSVDIVSVLRAMLPFASVTGAPKLRAVEILQKLEDHPRGVYCGAIGYIEGNRRAEFNVAIRTATLQHNQLHYYVGGGITFDSDPRAEYQETLAKAQVIWDGATAGQD